MSRQLKASLFHSIGGSPDITAQLPTLAPQDNDDETVLLAKITALLKRAVQQQCGGVIYDEGGKPRAVKRTFDNVAASAADDVQVTGVAGYRIRVISLVALAGGTATDLTFKSKPAGASAAIFALLANGANGGECLPRNLDGWFETLVGESLTVAAGAGSTTGIGINYILVPNYQVDEFGLVVFDESGEPVIE